MASRTITTLIGPYLVDPADITKRFIVQSSGATTGTTLTIANQQTTSQTLTLPNVSAGDTIVTINTIQTFTNKNLNATNCYIADNTDATKKIGFSTSANTTGITLTLASQQSTNQTLNIPNLTGSDTIAVTGMQQNLTNKYLSNINCYFVDGTDNTKKIAFQSSSATTATILTIANQQTTSQTLSIPNLTGADTIVTAASVQILTNKTLSLSSNTFSGYTAGSVLYHDGNTINQNNSSLFWDNANNRLLVGDTTVPAAVTGGCSRLYIENNVDLDLLVLYGTAMNSSPMFTMYAPSGGYSTNNNTGKMFQAKIAGEGTGRLMFYTDGMAAGSGSAMRDIYIYRTGANQWQIDSDKAGGANGNLKATGLITAANFTATNTTNQIILGTTNTTTINSPAPGASITLSLPTSTDTLVGRLTTDFLQNKSLVLGPTTYSTGTVSQSTKTVTGVSTVFTTAMIGGLLVYANGVQAFITAFISSTSLTVSQSQTVSSQAYTIYYGNLQIDNIGNIGLGGLFYSQTTNTYLYDATTPTKQLTFAASSASASTTLTLSSAITANRTITFPDATDTLVALTATQTLTHKTITDNTSNLIARSLWAGSGGSSVSVYAATAPSVGQVLTATSSSLATWQTPIGNPANTEDNNIMTYTTGTAYQSGTTIYGVSTTFPSQLSAYGSGGTIVWNYYSTGTASQSGTTITGSGTAWTSTMANAAGNVYITFANGWTSVITGYTSATSLTASAAATVSSQAYVIYITANIMGYSSGTQLTPCYPSQTISSSPGLAYTIYYTSNFSTSSQNFTPVTGCSITVSSAGNYYVTFSCSISTNNSNAYGYVAIFVNGVMAQNSQRVYSPASSTYSIPSTVSCKLTGVMANAVITAQGCISSGYTLTIYSPTLDVVSVN